AVLTVQQILALGEQASQMLGNPVYRTAHQLKLNELISDLIASEPQETKKREWLYHQIRALGAVADQTKQMVDTAKAVLKEQQESSQQRADDYMDRQGFGLDEDYNPFTDGGRI
ncbi:MAG: hypothetical protein AAGI72_24680, partial [Pseudomonadota bacterium]